MKKAIIGRKIGMTQIFDEKGNVIPVTVIEAGPCPVVQKKTVEKDGYSAIQIGFVDAKVNKVTKPLSGHFKKGDVAPKRFLKEFRLEDAENYNIGDLIYAGDGEISKTVTETETIKKTIEEKSTDEEGNEVITEKEVEETKEVEKTVTETIPGMFAVGDVVDVHGTSKGKGFAGTIKRFNTHRLKETHGSGPVVRHAGSMGAGTTPSKIRKGKKMPGHLGAEAVTVQNLTIVKINAENNLIAIKGAVPGPNKGIVTITSAIKKG